MSKYVSKFNMSNEDILIKDSEARTLIEEVDERVDEVSERIDELEERVEVQELSKVVRIDTLSKLATTYTNPTTDIYTCIRELFDDGFTCVIVPAGTYNAPNSKEIPQSNISIIGEHGALIKPSDGVQLRFTGEDIKVESLRIVYDTRTGGTRNSALYFSNSKTIMCNDLYFDYCMGNISFYQCQKVYVDRCHFNHTINDWDQGGSPGLWFGTCKYVDITESVFDESYLDGIIFDDITYANITNCRFHRNGRVVPTTGGALGSCGIYTMPSKNCDRVRIVNCEFTENGECGIDMSTPRWCEISNNYFLSNGLSGITIKSAFQDIICNNVFRNNGTNPTTSNPESWGHSGIDFKSNSTSNDLTMTGNIFCDSGTTASDRTQQYGINVLTGSTVNRACITGNRFSYNKLGAINGISNGVNSNVVISNSV